MKHLLLILFAALLMVAPGYQGYQAFATTDDDVFIDEGGGIGDAPVVPDVPEEDAPAAAAPAEPSAPVAQDEFLDEDVPPAPAPAPKAKPAKAPKPATVAKTPKAEKTPGAKSRKMASKEGFRMLKDADCEMRAEASPSSAVVVKVKGSRKLWVEDHDGEWVKGFRKTGHGFLSRECFE